MDGDRVVGVKTDRVGGSVYADAVILADGVNSLLAKKAGFHPELQPRDVALAVKEIHFHARHDDREPLQRWPSGGRRDRDGRQDHAGHGRHGFLYTNAESLTIGVGCLLSDLACPEASRRIN
jgi:electron transfer flavoprotein-quinone oxidoreductase